MKPDVLTVTALVFVIGVLISSMGITEGLNSNNSDVPPPALQQGVTAR